MTDNHQTIESNPFATGSFDLEAQDRLYRDESMTAMTYDLMIQAGWTPAAATEKLTEISRSRPRKRTKPDGAVMAITVILIIGYLFYQAVRWLS